MNLDESRKNGIKKCYASTFVKTLIENGRDTPCDQTNDAFHRGLELPAYFDSDKFKRGQQFFHKHIWAMLFSKVMGLVTILSIPDLAHILKFSQMSDTPMSAYKRYLKTVFHMYLWYNEDFNAESKLWKSIEKVRFKHNSASQRSRHATKISITQKNMALTQFGFMGYAVWRTKLVGIHSAERDDLEAFIHFWKVIGYMMGIEERFNICRDSVHETKEICNEIVVQIFKPEILKKHSDFFNLSYSLLTGMWCMMPLFQHKAFIQLTADTITNSTPTSNLKSCADSYNNNNNNNNNNNTVNGVYINRPLERADFGLNVFEKVYMQLIVLFLWSFRFATVRVFHQYVIYISMWLMENFPFLAYYRFGRANSHIKILD